MSRPIRIGVAHRGAGVSPVFAAIADGAMEAEGQSHKLIDTRGHPAALTALEAGEVDVINSVGPEVLRHNAENSGTAVILASAISRAAVEVFVRPEWPSGVPLSEARWGVLAKGDPDHVTALQVFEMEGWDPAALNLVEMPSGVDRLERLLSDSYADAVVLHAPEPALAVRSGWRRALDLSRFDAPMQNSCAVTTSAVLERMRPEILCYLSAFVRGLWKFRTDPQFGRSVLNRTCLGLDAAAIEQSWLFFARVMSGTVYPSWPALENARRYLAQTGTAVPSGPLPMDVSLLEQLEAEGIFRKAAGLR